MNKLLEQRKSRDEGDGVWGMDGGGGRRGGEHCSEILVGYCQGLYAVCYLAAPFMTSNNIRQDLSTYEAKLRLGTS